MDGSARAFRDFEHAGWQRAAGHYVDAFGGLTVQTSEPLLDAVRAAPGTRLLDVATGPGFVAARAAARGAAVTGLDFSAAMIARAEAIHQGTPNLTFSEGDATALPFDAGCFDAVVMNFGMLHLADPDAAVSEARRVLRAGGRFGFTVWAEPERAVGFGMVLRSIERFGNANVPLPEGPPFFRFSSADESRRTLERAGFSDVAVSTLPLVWRVATAEGVFEALSEGGVRTAAVLRAQTPAALGAIRDAVRDDVGRYAAGSAYELPMPAVLTAGTA